MLTVLELTNDFPINDYDKYTYNTSYTMYTRSIPKTTTRSHPLDRQAERNNDFTHDLWWRLIRSRFNSKHTLTSKAQRFFCLVSRRSLNATANAGGGEANPRSLRRASGSSSRSYSAPELLRPLLLRVRYRVAMSYT